MSEVDRAAALRTACDDLQAQLEAGDRTARHLDRDLNALTDAVQIARVHTETLADLQRHIGDLRANMREERAALSEVRKAARTLCASVARARETMTAFAHEKQVLEATQAALVAECQRLRDDPDGEPAAPPDLTGDPAKSWPDRD
jgi:chromosome segregation ATPase